MVYVKKADRDKRKKELIEEIIYHTRPRLMKWDIDDLELQLKFEVSLKN